MEIGKKIRFLRQQNNLTQEELGDRCELSKGFISQLENDMTSPSITTLTYILEALGTTLADFFAEEEEEKVIYGTEDYAVKVDEELKSETTWLISNAQKNEMEPILITVEPGGKTYPDNPHEGEEIGYVIEGKITVVIGNKRYTASKGESFYIKPDRPHYLENNGKRTARAIWISSPPSF
ncbi:MAG: cupin domain-containing protein [Clostridiales bacterium]|nr:cupin domain-containing protein [Clostridiales bacterium]